MTTFSNPTKLYFMRPTKSKQKLLYFKNLRKLNRKKWQLEKQARDSNEYVEIPKTLVGYKVCLTLIDSMRNKDLGLSEAIAASTSYFRFSEKPFRLCNLKNSWTIFDKDLWSFRREKMEAYFFKNKIYQKGKLELLEISEERFRKLSSSAQKYFIQGLDKIDHRGHPVFIYHPHIPKSYLREVEEKLFWNQLIIPDSVSESEAKKIENWMNTKRECELWHYEGASSNYYCQWENKKRRKKERKNTRMKIRNIIKGAEIE